MRTITFQKAVSGVVCALAAVFISPSASGQILNESAKLLASDGAAGDQFGRSVSVAGDLAVVGAIWDDDKGDASGAAYMFRRNPGAPRSWIQEQKVLPSDGAALDQFGISVSIWGNKAVIGAFGDDDNGSDSGSAYVFGWNGSTWVQEQKLQPSDGAALDQFGISVSVSGDVAVVGANSDDDNGFFSGSAYVFRSDGSSWVQEQKLLASDGAVMDDFGVSVSVSGDVVVVGARLHNGNDPNSGAAYVFRWNGSSWVEEQKLLASDGAASDFFGLSVSVSEDVAGVGAWGTDDNGPESGSSYVFRWNGSSWVQQQKLLASEGATGDHFGSPVSVSGNVAVVGAWGTDDNGPESGSSYLFRWNGSSWLQEHKLLASDGAASDQFGRSSVSVSGDVAVLGASGTDDNGPNSGSAYVFIGLCDSDGDGVCDSDDVCPGSDVGETIVVDGCDTGITNELSDDGCMRADAVAACADEARNHGQFVQCVAHLVNEWRRSGTINDTDHGRITHCAAHATIPRSDDKHGNGSNGPARLSDRAGRSSDAKRPLPSSGGKN
jgi:hypothetical protein